MSIMPSVSQWKPFLAFQILWGGGWARPPPPSDTRLLPPAHPVPLTITMYRLRVDTLHSLKKNSALPVVPLAHNRLQSFSILLFGPKTGWRNDFVENPKLNPNNHSSWRNVIFVTRSVYEHCWCSVYCTQ